MCGTVSPLCLSLNTLGNLPSESPKVKCTGWPMILRRWMGTRMNWTKMATNSATPQLIVKANQVGMLSIWSTERGDRRLGLNLLRMKSQGLTSWPVMDNADHINEHGEPVEDGQRDESGPQRGLGEQDEPLDDPQEHRTDDAT